MKKEPDRKLLEKLAEKDLLYFFLVSLISSDSLFTVKECEESLEMIDFCLDILSENDIKDKEKIEEMLLDGKEIVLRDMEHFKEQENKK